MSFLSDLGTVINEQFSFGENSTVSLDTMNGDRFVNFGLLGDYADQMDKTAERTYTIDGFIRNIRPNLRTVWFQQPDITVVVKKRMFSSLVDNVRLDLLEERERLLIASTKRLIQNKCRLVAAYERLSKIEQVTKEAGQYNTFLTPILLSSVNIFDELGLGGVFSPQTRVTIDTLHKVLSYSDTNDVTSYITNDFDAAFSGELGEGPGTFELTTMASVNTKVGTQFGAGNCSITIEDPYRLLVVTNSDIDQAISDATNFFQSSPFGKFTEIETKNLIDQLKNDLALSRGSRGASQIRFVVSPTTIISKRVRAIMEGTGQEIPFNYNSGLVGIGSEVELDPAWEGDGTDEKLSSYSAPGVSSSSEVRLFKRIISNIFLLMGYHNTTQSQIHEWKKETNYVRNRMRLMFNGRAIIQPMDVVNVFMTSRTQEDPKILSALKNSEGSGGFQIGQKFDAIVGNINATLSDLAGGLKNSPDEMEKNLIAGPDFPMWLWRLFRNDFTRQSAGTSIFVGLVSGPVSQNYNDGKMTLQVNCEDNSGYFTKSQINLKPALDVWNSALYDPLTPFDVSFDAATGAAITDVNLDNFPPLLPENQTLLLTRSARFKSRRATGQKTDPFLYKTDDKELIFNTFRNVLSDPDGMVYRWKQGIQSITKTERAYPQSSLPQDRSPLLTANPFAGQDVMNVLSLLVTGQPYNYNTFLKAAIANGNSIMGNDPITNEPAAISYIESLTEELSRRNAVWGNFVPFKKMVLNEASIAYIRSGENDLLTRNQQLNSLIKKRAALRDRLMLQTAGLADDPDAWRWENNQFVPNISATNSTENVSLKREIESLDRKISIAQNNFTETVKYNQSLNPNASISIFGDDISYDSSLSGISSSDDEFAREDFRKRINFLTLRRLWKTKANDDQNYFIVDDQYDNNYDIQGFERRIGNSIQLLQSDYTSIDEQIKSVAKLLDMEIFADTQGHIQARPPQYNKMPSSVFYKMFQERDRTGVKVFPDALESLFTNQIKGLINRIEILEDQIRLYVVALGVAPKSEIDPDKEIRDFLGSSVDGGTGFTFLSSGTTGKIGGDQFETTFIQARPELDINRTGTGLTANVTSQLEQLGNLSNIVSNASRAPYLFDVSKRVDVAQKIDYKAAMSTKVTDRSADIRERLEQKTGRSVPKPEELFANNKLKREANSLSQLDALNIIDKIAQFVSERQKMVISLSNATKNLIDGLQVNYQDDSANSVLMPNMNRFTDKATIPSILQHMIEDEDEDDIDYGAGRRFILKPSMYSKLNISENPPPYTLIQVNGYLGEGFADPPGSLTTSSDGNAVVSAYAVDYDMWYMYGFKATNSIPAPFFSDPDSQCAPYAVFNLLKARQDILQGSVDVHCYNEYYQPGDVIHIEDRDLLFYVTDVAHNFSYGSLSTTLTLKYGHSPGEYIPTMLDVVGKILYNAQGFSGQFRSSRFDSKDGDQAIGAIIVEDFSLEGILGGDRGELNRKVLANLMVAASGALNLVNFRNVKPKLEIRYYTPGSNDSQMANMATEIKRFLTNPSMYSSLTDSILGQPMDDKTAFTIPGDQIEIKAVDINTDAGTGPSRAAWSSVRLLQTQGIGNNTEMVELFTAYNESQTTQLEVNAATLDSLMTNYILDIFITYDSIDSSLEPGNSIDQATQQVNAAIAEANSRGGL